MTIFGIDVDQGRGVIDWPKVAASGIKFAIMRCVREGDLGVDTAYARNVSGARAVSITPGAYAFLSGGGRAATQASLFIATVGDPTGMLIVCDVESGALTPTAADVRTFQAALRAAWPNHPLLTYGSRGGPLGGLGALSDLGPLWLADYGANIAGAPAVVYKGRGGAVATQWHSTFGGWTSADIWQFGSKGQVPGIAGSVDIDAIETADLAALTGSAGGTDVLAIVKDIARFKAPRTFTTKVGTTLNGYDPARPGVVVKSYKIATASPGTFAAVVSIEQSPNATVIPHGAPFLEATGGTYAGLYVVASLVTANLTPDAAPVVAPPPDTSPFTQADVAAKVAAAVTADRAKARITYG